MRKHLLSLPLLVGLLLTASCSGSSAVPHAALGQQFTLAIGQSAVITRDNLRVKFLAVTTDSRCPGDVTCIRAGEVSCLIEIGPSDAPDRNQITITQTGLTDEAGKATFNGYQVLGTVKPYPKSTQTISTQDYRLMLTITKL